jgi:hypothetical protein
MTGDVVKVGFWLRAFDSVAVEADTDAEAIEKAKAAATEAMASTAHPEHVDFDERREGVIAFIDRISPDGRQAVVEDVAFDEDRIPPDGVTAAQMGRPRRAASSSRIACPSMSRSRTDWFPGSPLSTKRRSPIRLPWKATPATWPKRSPPRMTARPGLPGSSVTDDLTAPAPHHTVGRFFRAAKAATLRGRGRPGRV